MPTNYYKVLGQVVPSTGVDTTLYTVPSSGRAVISTLTVCNTYTASTSYRIAVRPTGTSLQTKHYVAYDAPIEQYQSSLLTLGLSLGPSDVITVRSAGSGIAFNAYGVEII